MKFKAAFLLFFVFPIILGNCKVERIDHNFCGNQTLPMPIPGTELQTHSFYKISLARFPNGTLSWATKPHKEGSHYIQTDNRPNNTNYDTGGMWRPHGQWTILPTGFPDHSEWFLLVNRGLPGEYARISTTSFTNQQFLVLSPNYYPKFYPRQELNDFHWKFERHTVHGKTYYQLRPKNFPRGIVTWDSLYLENNNLIQLDTTGDERYKVGGEWYLDTLFQLEAAGSDKPSQGQSESSKGGLRLAPTFNAEVRTVLMIQIIVIQYFRNLY